MSSSGNAQRFVAKHVDALPRSGIRDFFDLVARHKNAVSLGIGEPDFTSPWNVRQAAITSLEKGRTSYTENKGLLRLRKAIIGWLERHFQLSWNPEDEVLVCVGVSQALDLALRALINPGEKVMFQDPCYVSYLPGIQLAHGIGIAVPTRVEDGFALTAEALRKAWEPGCRVLLLNFPANPTGATLNRQEMEGIARFACEKDLLVITDEIYAELTFEGQHVSIATLPGMKERTLFLHGFSKAFAMTGFRLGYACGPAAVIEGMMKIHQYSMLCAPILSQEAGIEALENGRDAMEHMRDQYRQRRDYVVRSFNAMGLRCHSPRGAFYAFPSIAHTGLGEMDFAKKLLEKEQVAVVPGTAFGAAGKGFIRASYATGQENLIKAMERMKRFMDGLGKS